MKMFSSFKRIYFFIALICISIPIHTFDQFIFPELDSISITKQITHVDKKKWTLIIYMAADNDLRGFAARNIKQMAQIGSNEHINIIIHLDIRISGNKKVTRRYYVEKDAIVHVNADDPHSQSMDSGNPNTLISCCAWGINSYPAEHYGVIFWNHGSGTIDFTNGRILNTAEMFTFNPRTNKLELDRSIDFFENNDATTRERFKCHRGVCWDDTSGNYLTNQKLDKALEYVCTHHLNGGKFSLIGFDACFMAMLEVAEIVKKYADIMVGSQEVELGTGWDYKKILTPFNHTHLAPTELADHIVNMYKMSYHKLTNDYTQSALDLNALDLLEVNIDSIGNTLIECISIQKNRRVTHAIRASRSKSSCTHFSEPSYIDLYDFYTSLLKNIKYFDFKDAKRGHALKNHLEKELREGKKLIEEIVFANVTGKSLARARGLSIYFPTRSIHPSYHKTTFANSNRWASFLGLYLVS